LQKWNYDQSGKVEITTKLKTDVKSIDSSMLNVNLIVKYATSLNEVTVNKNNLINKIQLGSHNIEILGINNNIIGLAMDTIDIDKTVINLINFHTIDSSYKSPVAISEADKLGYQTNYSNDKNSEPRYLYELIVNEEKMNEQEIIQAYKKNLSKVNSMQVYFDQQVELIANIRPIGQKFILYSYEIDSEIIQIK
jgi:hypothetical protein